MFVHDVYLYKHIHKHGHTHIFSYLYTNIYGDYLTHTELTAVKIRDIVNSIILGYIVCALPWLNMFLNSEFFFFYTACQPWLEIILGLAI